MDESLDKDEFPRLCYTRDLQDWRDFIRRTPDEYAAWVDGAAKECEILELKILEDLKQQERKIFVDTNISIVTLKKISDMNHILVMLADQDASVKRFLNAQIRKSSFYIGCLCRKETLKQQWKISGSV